MSSIVFPGFVPHPPLLVEGIGDKEKAAVRESRCRLPGIFSAGWRQKSRYRGGGHPHGPVFSDAYTMADWDPLGAISRPYGATVAIYPALTTKHMSAGREVPGREAGPAPGGPEPPATGSSSPCAVLDHGTMVPLWVPGAGRLAGAGWCACASARPAAGCQCCR